MTDYTVRAAPLRHIPSILGSLGCDSRLPIESVGLSTGFFDYTENQIPYDVAARLIDSSAKVSDHESFGLSLGQRFSLMELGLVGRVAHSSASVKTALYDMIEAFHLHDSGGIITLDNSARLMSLGYRSILPGAGSLSQVNDMCLACLCLVMRELCGPDWSPARVELTRPRPADELPYREFFRAPISYGAKRNVLSFSGRWLDRTLLSSNLERHMALRNETQGRLKAASPELATQVRRLLHRRLYLGGFGSDEIADALCMHERTLRRRLRQEKTSFSKLLDEVRQASSCQLLKDTELSIGDIARELGYSSTDAFDHAFRRWHGVSPRKWRGLCNAPGRSVELLH